MIGENGIDSVSWFIGYVEDNNDRNGRVRVRAFGFHPPASEGTVATEDLPWAHVARDSKVITPFDTGDLVVGFFMDGRDAQHPVVLGTINSARFSSPAAAAATISTPGGSSPKANIGAAVNAELNAQQRAFLDAIALKESGGSYTALSGGGDVSLSGGHPNIKGPSGTTAAGRYQFTYGTWVDANGGVNAPFTPANQDYAAWNLASQRYMAYGLDSSLGYPDLNSYLEANGTTSELLTGLSGTWEAFSPSLGNQQAIIDAYNNSLAGQGGVPSTVAQFENPYLAPSQDAVANFGNPALPPQITGENIEQTAAVVQAATRRSVSFSNGYTSEEPAAPTVGHVTDTAVWNTRYGGSNITMSGKNGANEYIDINHASGSRVTLDGNGNITIKAMGRVYIGSEGDIEESSEGMKIAHHMGGYAMEITGGKLQIMSAGDIEISTGGNLTLNSGGKMTFNAGDSIDIAGSRVAATARVDAINLVSAGKLALHSQSVGLSLSSGEAVFVESKAQLNLKSGEDTRLTSGGVIGIGASGNIMVKGAEIHLNDGDAPNAGSALTAVAANVPNAIPLKVIGDSKPKPTPSDISPSMADDTTGPQ